MTPIKTDGAIEPVIIFLGAMAAFFTVVLLYAAHMFPNDGVIFATLAAVLNNCTGALFMRVKAAKGGDDTNVNIGDKTTVQGSNPIVIPGADPETGKTDTK